MVRGADVDAAATAGGWRQCPGLRAPDDRRLPTGIRMGALGSSTAATYTSYVTVDVPDTGSLRKQVADPDDGLQHLRDPEPRRSRRYAAHRGRRAVLAGAGAVRPERCLPRLDDDRPRHARAHACPSDHRAAERSLHPADLAVVGDLGAKSPLANTATDRRRLHPPGYPRDGPERHRQDRDDPIVQLWQSARTRPRAFRPPGARGRTFARACSSRPSAAGGTLVAPRLRITFQRSFPFENP